MARATTFRCLQAFTGRPTLWNDALGRFIVSRSPRPLTKRSGAIHRLVLLAKIWQTTEETCNRLDFLAIDRHGFRVMVPLRCKIKGMRTVEFWDWDGICALVYLEGETIIGDCRAGHEILIQAILADYDFVDRNQIWAHTHAVEWFERLPKKYSCSAIMNACEVSK
jgi:hypothetical protein